jgi:catechol 2,3-dioxygenase-like lactoylglutathione lyase family enzyme
MLAATSRAPRDGRRDGWPAASNAGSADRRRKLMGVADSATLHHACFVVRDLDKTAKKMADDLSIGPWHVFEIEPEECVVNGEPVALRFRVALADVGGASYELLEPGEGDNFYREHLDTAGEGLHHTCLLYESRDAMRAARDEMLAQGREMVLSASLGEGGELCYFRVEEAGTLLELLFLAGMPEPDLTIT